MRHRREPGTQQSRYDDPAALMERFVERLRALPDDVRDRVAPIVVALV